MKAEQHARGSTDEALAWRTTIEYAYRVDVRGENIDDHYLLRAKYITLGYAAMKSIQGRWVIPTKKTTKLKALVTRL